MDFAFHATDLLPTSPEKDVVAFEIFARRSRYTSKAHLKASPRKSNVGSGSQHGQWRGERRASMRTRTERDIGAVSAVRCLAVSHQQSFAEQTLHQYDLSIVIEFAREIAHRERRPRQREIDGVPYKQGKTNLRRSEQDHDLAFLLAQQEHKVGPGSNCALDRELSSPFQLL